MLPRTHAILGFILSAVLFFLVPGISLFDALLVFLASVFIDVDHYVYYAVKKKDWSLRNAYSWFLKRRYWDGNKKQVRKYPILTFHGFEFLFLLALLSFIDKIFLFALIGAAFHLVLDLFDLAMHKQLLRNKLSCIYVYQTNKNKKELA